MVVQSVCAAAAGASPGGRAMTRVLSEARRVFLAVALIATVVAFAAGLFAVLNDRDKLLTTISFSMAFLSFVFSTITTFPRMVQRMKESLRALLYIVIALVAACLIPLSWLVLQEPVIKIGVSFPFRGADSSEATAMYKAIKQAVSDGTSGTWRIDKYRIQLVPFDDSDMGHDKVHLVPEAGPPDKEAGPPDDTEDFATITGDAQVAGIIGPFNSGTAVREIPPTSSASIPLISPSNSAGCLTTLTDPGHDDLDECGFEGVDKTKRTYFRMATVDSFRADVLAGYFAKEGIGKEAAIFKDGSLFGESFAHRLREAWLKVNRDARIYDLTGDPQKDLEELEPAPDVILFAGTGPKGILLHEAMERTQYADTTFAAAASIMSGGLADSSATGDIYAISPYGHCEDSPQYLRFFANYTNAQKEPPKEPTTYSAGAYDATNIMLLAIESALRYRTPPAAGLDILSQADGFRREVVDDIRRVSPDYSGATGTVRFDSSGNAVNTAISSQEHGAAIYRHIKGTDNVWSYVPYISNRQ
jgi:branched-chain amino acid transport system substrate-binding protein